MVRICSGCGMDLRTLAKLIINPETGKSISPQTVNKVFEPEVTAGRAEVQALCMTTLVRKIKDGDNTCLIWAMKNLCGWRDNFNHEVGGVGGGPVVTSIEISFVPGAHSQMKTINGKANGNGKALPSE